MRRRRLSLSRRRLSIAVETCARGSEGIATIRYSPVPHRVFMAMKRISAMRKKAEPMPLWRRVIFAESGPLSFLAVLMSAMVIAAFVIGLLNCVRWLLSV